MPIYLNGNKYVGGYLDGKRINGYMNNKKMFIYTTTITINFSNGSSQTLYNVPLTSHPQSINDLQNYGLEAPQYYELNDNSSYSITPNCSISVSVTQLTTSVSVYFSDGRSQTLYNVPEGYQDTGSLTSYGLNSPDPNFNIQYGSFTITSNCGISVTLSEKLYPIYLNYTDGVNNPAGNDTVYKPAGTYGSDIAPDSIDINTSFEQGMQMQNSTMDMYVSVTVGPNNPTGYATIQYG